MWKACSTCKKPIGFSAKYFVCSVSTCQRERVGFQFCAEDCWDAHVPMMRHRESWAEERRAPSEQQAREAEAAIAVKPASVVKSATAPRHVNEAASSPDDILVVASKLKAYIKEKSGMSTSDGVLTVLSHRLRRLSDNAMASAQRNGRKTVLDRDF